MASMAASALGPTACSTRSSSSSMRSRWARTEASSMGVSRRGVQLLHGAALSEVHVDPTGQAGVEAAHGAHDVDALEVVGPVLLEDRRTRHGVLVGSGCAVAVARAAVPGRGRIGVVVGDLPAPDDEV